ncbi:hypothetical protein HanXRQr2_Chr08g0344291 [Helianthus annuus]|uniref:Uncharacterized protein n=1 Tax=Helianthus annuus TaxID=4232 RepID=A0A251U6D8_HELAN|nr:hypothetical protein HanXRQr2_Chr08g0344291 [Helianthus annuus]KAJ0605409.1 hypothetical protein HanHA300_Chr02g0062741 [Helianthus annuus]KAJ0952482.1 hypothetical protein HanPSC8_Chr02g0072791 [Helianthus annuus]
MVPDLNHAINRVYSSIVHVHHSSMVEDLNHAINISEPPVDHITVCSSYLYRRKF